MAHALKSDWRSAPLTERQRALCEYAAKLTRHPATMEESDIERLRAVGLSDVEILGAIHVTGYFNYLNRLADAVGIDPEDFMPRRKEG